MPLRIVFCGTPAFGLPALKQLIAEKDFSIEAVITQPDRPSGRGQKPATPPIKNVAVEAGIRIYQPEKIRQDAAREFLRDIAPDAVVIIAYGQIIPSELLQIPRLGWINLHGSLLPRDRGAAPIQRAILQGETRTGLTTMQIDAGLDTGPILEQREIQIGADETTPQLMARMAEEGAPLMIETLLNLDRGAIAPRPQDNSLATFAPPLRKGEGLVGWLQPAQVIYNQIRALQPWPGTYTRFRNRMCHIWGKPAESPSVTGAAEPGTIVANRGEIFVACGSETWLNVSHVQPEGRKRMTAQEFANGARFAAKERFLS
ncbi:MAG TPA: methionyl-tRNA formyltransferase [Candidatus Acidoferrales bacterium]|nr:methionyl-tRNA formyltransferase [Candidatus Acidoferrales bacterium]